MLTALSHRTVICQSISEVSLIGEAPLGAVGNIFIFFWNCTEWKFAYVLALCCLPLQNADDRSVRPLNSAGPYVTWVISL